VRRLIQECILARYVTTADTFEPRSHRVVEKSGEFPRRAIAGALRDIERDGIGSPSKLRAQHKEFFPGEFSGDFPDIPRKHNSFPVDIELRKFVHIRLPANMVYRTLS
jgi:hypothetical protein